LSCTTIPENDFLNKYGPIKEALSSILFTDLTYGRQPWLKKNPQLTCIYPSLIHILIILLR